MSTNAQQASAQSMSSREFDFLRSQGTLGTHEKQAQHACTHLLNGTMRSKSALQVAGAAKLFPHTCSCVVDDLRNANNAHHFFAAPTELSTTTTDKGNALHGMKIVGPRLPGAPRIPRVCSETQAIFWHFCARELCHNSLQQTQKHDQTNTS